jgi:hypothetical protein
VPFPDLRLRRRLIGCNADRPGFMRQSNELSAVNASAAVPVRHRSRYSVAIPHLVITGPGRSGTTLLVKLFGRLGFDIGDPSLDYFEHARAGLETDILDPSAGYVVKDPDLMWRLGPLLDSGQAKPEDIDWLIVPLRNLEAAAASRIAMTTDAREVHAPGGLIGTARPRKQRQQLAEMTYALLEVAARYELPLILLEYPLFARDVGYAYRRLRPVLGDYSEEEFTAAWSATVDPTLVRDTSVKVPRLAEMRVAMLRVRFLLKRHLGR